MKTAIKDNDGNVLSYPKNHKYAGKNVVIKTGGSVEERKQAIATLDDILETFGFAKYVNTSRDADALINQYKLR